MKDYLEHYGVPGQRWGVRNYQNADGSLTSKGRQHYDVGDGRGGRNALSLRAGYNRAMAKAMDINANYYSKRNGRYAQQMSGIQRAAAQRTRKDAERYQREANKKAQERLDSRNARLDKRQAINSKTNDLYNSASTLEKLIYNKKTYESMAKKMLDKNMTYSEASKSAKKEAIRNTAIFLAAFGALEVGVLAKQQHDFKVNKEILEELKNKAIRFY